MLRGQCTHLYEYFGASGKFFVTHFSPLFRKNISFSLLTHPIKSYPVCHKCTYLFIPSYVGT